jgi:betaine reductase
MTSPTVVQPVVRGVRYVLAHTPGLVRYGSKPSRDIAGAPAVADRIAASLRSWDAARDYPAHQVLLGGRQPDSLREVERPWWNAAVTPGPRTGPHGEIIPEEELYGLLKIGDAFDLITLERSFATAARSALASRPLVASADLGRLGDGVADGEVAARLSGPLPALPLWLGSGQRIGSISAGHESDVTLGADVLLENLAAKATAALALRGLLAAEAIDPTAIDYVLNSGEEAVGDRYQRGGGNLAKAVAEQVGCARATGVDVKGFCCGPVHALVLAGSLIASRAFERVVVVAGGSLAKLGMKYQGHLRLGHPVLEDVLAGAAILVTADDGRSPRLRLDVLGRHTVSAGSSQKAIFEALVAEPLERLGLTFADVDKYATELQNPELTEPSGSGDVPALNYRVIAGLAALRKEIAPRDVDAFVRRHGMPGFSPTQGHFASAIPFLGHALDGLRGGSLQRTLLLAKGSLFLGRMTQMADGLSILLDRNPGR